MNTTRSNIYLISKNNKNNSQTEFSTEFSPPMRLSPTNSASRWGICIEEISFDAVFPKSANNVFKIKKNQVLMEIEDLYNTLTEETPEFLIIKADREYNLDINTDIEDFFISILPRLPYIARMYISKNDANYIEITSQGIQLSFTNEFAEFLGLNSDLEYSRGVENLPTLKGVSMATRMQTKRILGQYQVALKYTPPRIIHILSDEVQGQCFSGHNLNSKVLLREAFNLTENGTYTHQVRYPIYHLLRTENIPRISISIVDENFKPLAVNKGQETVIQCKIGLMNMNYFNLEISNDITAGDPSQISNFRVQLKNRPTMHQWKPYAVSLRAVNLQCNFNILPIAEFKMSVLSVLSNTSMSINIDTRAIETLSDFGDLLGLNLVNCVSENVAVEVLGDDIAKTVTFSSSASIIITLPSIICHLIGDKDASVEYESTQDLSVNASNLTTFNNADITRCMPHHLYLYTDFIHASRIGEDMKTILKVINIPSSALKSKMARNQYINLEWETLEWRSISRYDLDHIQFSLKNSFGQPAQFRDQSKKIYMSLLIKPE